MASRAERRAKSWSATTRKCLAGASRFPGVQELSGEAPHAGLGTSIVEALAQQLNATVEKTSGAEGTTVTITAPAVSAGVATGGRTGVGA